MGDKDRATPTSADELPLDAQELREGTLSDDEKLDIALEGSMMTSEPPQIAEPKTAAESDAESDGRPAD